MVLAKRRAYDSSVMRRGAVLFLVGVGVALAAACGDEPVEAPPVRAVMFESGTRLRANVFESEDGTELFVDFHDSVLDLDCSFEETTAGFRCLPPHSLDMQLRFSDDGCTTPVGLAPTSLQCRATSPFVAARGEDAGCPLPTGRPVSAVYRATAAHQGEDYFQGAPGTCFGPFFGLDWHELEPVPLESFAEAKEQLTAAHDGLATRMLVSSDGAKVALGLFDTERQAPCTPYRDGPDLFRCVPPARVMTDRQAFIGDCEDLGMARTGVLAHACNAPALVVDRLLACPPSLDVFETGEPVSGDEAILFGDCSTVSSIYPSDFTVLPLGDPIDVGELPVVRSRQVGVGRLTTRVATSEDGTVLAVPLTSAHTIEETRMFDELFGQPCSPMADADGIWRCVSGPRFEDIALFADASCSSPVVFAFPCVLPSPSAGFVADCFSGPLTGAIAIGAPVPQTYVDLGDDGCFPSNTEPDMFVVTGERPLDDFPRLEKKRK